jgi:ATP-dependent helicase/nuclease subunit A
VQGVVDLILEFDDHIVLIDYKYSSSPINKLREKYNTQLYLYKLALERAFHKPVTQSLIYSIKTGDLG